MNKALRVSVMIGCMVIAMATPRSAWSDNDCINCGPPLTGSDSITRVTEYINAHCRPIVNIHSLCDSMDIVESFDDDIMNFFTDCGDKELDVIHAALRNVECRNNDFKESYPYRDSIRLLPLISHYIPTSSSFIKQIADKYIDAGRADDLAEIMNTPDHQGRAFLDYIEFIRQFAGEDTYQYKDLQRVINLTCNLGGRYSQKPQPEGCQTHERLRSHFDD
ncbi:hypothetical protein [Pseudoponticoccus marisrubri]|uniref:hypothetical protein n=1 Tax=Pseudoponticoccus marisrubri TaxID=1685382 RepID=UPI0012FDAAFF|nr:hypothetical protein [Pseudoponticoccus marisrubri]